MNCPYCHREMDKGYLRSGSPVWFYRKKHIPLWKPDDVVTLTENNFTGPICDAWCCGVCRKIIVEYAQDVRAE